MGRIFTLEDCQKCAEAGPSQLKDWCYNALDVTGTREIADVLLPRLTPDTAHVYAFERSLQNPALAMGLRGVRVDTLLRDKMVAELRRELAKDMRAVAKLPQVAQKWDAVEKETGVCLHRPPSPSGKAPHHKWPRGVSDAERKCEACGLPRLKPKAFNPMSPDDVQHLLYDLLAIPPMMNKKKEVSVDEDVLERMALKHSEVKPITDAILAVRDKKKQLGTLSARLTPTNRYTSTFHVGAAWTGRFSSSQSPYRWGGNLQNIAERHRKSFIADPGMELGYADLKTAESFVVAHRAGDEEYIRAHKEGDVHTLVARLVWPDKPWTGDIHEDKKLAKSLYPEWDNVPGHDLRFQSKSVQHGGNLGLTPIGVSLQKKIPRKDAEKAMAAYFNAFPFIKGWQEHTRGTVMAHLPQRNPLGRTVTLFGRPTDNHTINQAYAFYPQSTVADILDLAMWRVWWEMDPHEIQLLAQVHDALLFQFPKGRLDLVRKMVSLMRIPVDITDYRGTKRRMVIGVEVAVGANWGHMSESNPHGLKEVEV